VAHLALVLSRIGSSAASWLLPARQAGSATWLAI
jgi:hypothetical protein